MKNSADKQYLELVQKILDTGSKKSDRTGTGTISIFSHEMRFDMREGFPLLTSKKIFTKAVIHELIWFLRGDTNIKYLVDNGVHIWDGDAYKNYEKFIDSENLKGRVQAKKLRSQGKLVKQYYLNKLSKEEFIEKIKLDNDFAKKWGELGPIYGKQWRGWRGFMEEEISGSGLVSPQIRYIPFEIDQIKNIVEDLRNDPDSRRLIVSAWNLGDIGNMVLPPCHNFFQCWTREMTKEELSEHSSTDGNPTRFLSMKVNIRSNDIFLGNPFNIASYSILLHLLAKEVNMIPLELIISIGDAHIYQNHVEACHIQLKNETYPLPKLKLDPNCSIFNLKFEDIKIVGYQSSPLIKAELSN
jgi:thymidylate synthase